MLLRELFPLLTALLVAVVVYVARERRRRRMRIAPPRPDLAMREVCDRPALLEVERACLATDAPRVAFRRAAIENAVAALYLEAIAGCGVAAASAVKVLLMLSRSVRIWISCSSELNCASWDTN